MSTDSFRRHTRARVDDAIHRIFLSLHGDQVAAFEPLARVVRARSDLLTHAHVHVDVLQNMFAFRDAFIRSPEAWPGMTGHPLRIVESLAGHLFGSYPTPRFLASAWFGGATPVRVEHRRWFIAHAAGQSFRKLALPVLAALGPLVDFLRANLGAIDLRGRTFASVMRRAHEWHGTVARSRVRFVSWPRSRWNELVVPVEPTASEPRRAEWRLTELLDSRQLACEGRAMRHCVATYARSCAAGHASIWSLRHRWCDAVTARSVITIEVWPGSRSIVQVRGPANSVPRGGPLELVRRWAARERLVFHRSLGAWLSDAGAR